MVSFIRNAWYCAGWAPQLKDTPKRIKILGEDLALYRDSQGVAHAIGNRCPHRFAALSVGKIVGDTLECPYHGLQFNGQGQCVHNPHGQGIIPPQAKVPSYILVEQQNTLWIWMGDPALADPANILDLSFLDDDRFAYPGMGQLHFNCEYQLLNDNLLDVTHIAYIHPTTVGLPPEILIEGGRMEFEVKTSDGVVEANYGFFNIPPSAQMKPFFPFGDRGDQHAYFHWHAPSSFLLDICMTPPNVPRKSNKEPSPDVLVHPMAHLFTPETEGTCHYFYAVTRNIDIDNPEGTKLQEQLGRHTFSTEDKPILEECWNQMDGEDFWSLKPAILETDRAAIIARRVVAQMVARERGATPVREIEPETSAAA